MKREGLIKQMAEEKRPWDLLIIGGGATGLGVAVDASSRGYRVLLVEQHDFAFRPEIARNLPFFTKFLQISEMNRVLSKA